MVALVSTLLIERDVERQVVFGRSESSPVIVRGASWPRPEEDEPNRTHHDHGQADTDDKQSQYGRAGFGLPGFRRSFNNDAVFLDGHIVLR